MNTLRGYSVALRTDKRPFVFAFDHYGSVFVFFVYSVLDHAFPTSELIDSDTFRDTAFFSCGSSDHTPVEIIDFIRDAHQAEIMRMVSYMERPSG